jgi:hemin uptake protein HemP
VNSRSNSGHPPGTRPPDDRRDAISARPPTLIISSDALFRGAHEIGIEHDGSLYRLKVTRQGKLILNK